MRTAKKPFESICFQERDIALLRGLFECRVMTNGHISTLYFDGKIEAAKKRLQKIKNAGLVSERPRRAFEPSVLFLTRKGLGLLQKEGVLRDYPVFAIPSLERRARVSDLTIRHELEVMDVKAAFHSAIKATPQLTLAAFSTWPLLNEFMARRPDQRGKEVLVQPDGFIRIHETEANGAIFEHTFFLEVDRSSEVQGRLVALAGCYLDYYKSGGFAARNGASKSDFKEYPFRVLMVFKTAERRNNTAERLLDGSTPILTQVCLSTISEVRTNPLGAIWIRPLEYRDAVKDTPFGIKPISRHMEYKRQTTRELFVEKNVRKLKILTAADER